MFPEGISYRWQSEAITGAWEATKEIVMEEIERRNTAAGTTVQERKEDGTD